ncbi:Holliday junction branch migration protein RuvA [Pseudothioclava arenosa]|uniref:Holliday junction branch migration complex subunit RuvA n=1 Tax=Pseudothioclava arenosa TaxID=1795308 RepID=A0A2A4CU60_9RHOB|nr:Holliday junction branch migration protein RuvA [Pseudothioclava arenosa]PCD77802.1 Holliday junction branch migration protein RuvA [Pseudothioclava arenosa]
MIGRIAGILIHRAPDHVMIDVRGVGYIVHVSQRTAQTLPPVGEACALYTDLVVREDLLQLIGFPSLLEKEWHRLLTSVQGVGAKVSLALLGTLGAEGLGRAIALGDWGAVKAAPGVGPKLAQRIVMELKDKAPSVMALGTDLSVDLAPSEEVIEPAAAPHAKRPAAPAAPRVNYTAEALSALTNLGYSPADAAGAVARASEDAEIAQDTAKLIRAALRLLAPKD